MISAFQWGGGDATATPSPYRTAAAATPSPRRPMSSAHTTPYSANSSLGNGSGSGSAMMMMGARAGNLAEGRGGERGTTIYDICGAAPTSPSERSRCVNFVPAGGSSGLNKPEGSSGRRGSAGKCLALAGDGVSRSLADAASPPAAGGGDSGGGFAVDTPLSAAGGARAGPRGATSPGIFGGEGEGGGGGGSPSPRLSRRRQSNTGQLRELVEAWPEDAAVAAASPAGEQRRGSNANDNGNGNGNDDRDASPSRYGSSSPGAPGSLNLKKGGLERR